MWSLSLYFIISKLLPYLVPDVPLGLLALVRELGSERDLFALALLHLLLRGLLDPLEFFLQCRGVTALELTLRRVTKVDKFVSSLSMRSVSATLANPGKSCIETAPPSGLLA